MILVYPPLALPPVAEHPAPTSATDPAELHQLQADWDRAGLIADLRRTIDASPESPLQLGLLALTSTALILAGTFALPILAALLEGGAA